MYLSVAATDSHNEWVKTRLNQGFYLLFCYLVFQIEIVNFCDFLHYLKIEIAQFDI